MTKRFSDNNNDNVHININNQSQEDMFFQMVYNTENEELRKMLASPRFGAYKWQKMEKMSKQALNHIFKQGFFKNTVSAFNEIMGGQSENVGEKFDTETTKEFKEGEIKIKDLEKTMGDGFIPPEILYGDLGGRLLNDIDEDYSNNYTISINHELNTIFLDAIWDSKFLYEPLIKCTDRIDIGTGNGIVSSIFETGLYDVAFSGYTYDSYNFLYGGSEFFKFKFPKIQMYDLSQQSLKIASHSFEKMFGKSLSHLCNVEYFPNMLNNIHEGNKNNIITMINFLPNFNIEKCKELLEVVYKKMGKGDVFMPTFFKEINKTPEGLLGLDLDYFLEELDSALDEVNARKIFDEYIGMNLFELSTIGLYKNKATKQWIMKSFEDYLSPDNQGKYSVELKRDEYDTMYVEVSVLYPQGTKFFHKGKELNLKNVKHDENGDIKFIAFNSYRLKVEDIKKLCREVGFEILRDFSTENNLISVPYLMKPE